MSNIDYANKTDRDLLIEVVTTTNGMSQKLGSYCDKVDNLERNLITGGWANLPPMSRKEVMATAGAGGGIVGLLIILIQILEEFFRQG